MKIIPLGTSSGQPTLERGVTGLAAFVGSEKRWVLVDCGEGTQQKIMQARLGIGELSAILITHGHGDHCFGLFGLMAQLSMAGRTKPLPVIAPPEVRKMVREVHALSKTHLTYPVEWQEPSAGLRIKLGDELSCLCVEMSHRAPSHGYLLESSKRKDKADADAFAKEGFEPGPLLGAAIAAAKRGDQSWRADGTPVDLSWAVESEWVKESLFVGGDNLQPERVAKAAPGALCWVHEATYAHEEWAKGSAGEKWGHSSAKMVGQAAAAGAPKALVLTHFSPRYGEGPKGVEKLAEEAAQSYKGPIHLAMDLVPLEFAPIVEPMPKPKRAPKV